MYEIHLVSFFPKINGFIESFLVNIGNNHLVI